MIVHACFKVSSENGVRNTPYLGIPACRSDKEEQTDRHNGRNRRVEKRSPEVGGESILRLFHRLPLITILLMLFITTEITKFKNR